MSTQKNDLQVKNVMLDTDSFAVIGERTILKEALESMNESRLGIVCIVDSQKKLKGIITDGDIRRMLLTVQKPFSAFFVDDSITHAIQEPVTVKENDLLTDAIAIMGDKQIWDLPAVDENNKLVGLVHLHPAVKLLLDLK